LGFISSQFSLALLQGSEYEGNIAKLEEWWEELVHGMNGNLFGVTRYDPSIYFEDVGDGDAVRIMRMDGVESDGINRRVELIIGSSRRNQSAFILT
jgi:hypothetical protein